MRLHRVTRVSRPIRLDFSVVSSATLRKPVRAIARSRFLFPHAVPRLGRSAATGPAARHAPTVEGADGAIVRGRVFSEHTAAQHWAHAPCGTTTATRAPALSI